MWSKKRGYIEVHSITSGPLAGAQQIKPKRRWKWRKPPRKRISSVPREGIGVVPHVSAHEDSSREISEATPGEEIPTTRPPTVWANKYRQLEGIIS